MLDFLFVCFVVLGFEFKTLVLYHLSHTASPFCFSYFLNRVLLLCQASPYHNPSYTSSLAEMRGMCHHTQLLLVEEGF
jgi:hypothetical protein